MTSKAQKEKILKLKIKEKKLTRLFYSEDLSNKDTLALNRIYEEQQVLHFRYAIVGAGLFSTVTGYSLFRFNTTLLKVVYFTASALAINIGVGARLNARFNRLVEPYFEKYQIK